MQKSNCQKGSTETKEYENLRHQYNEVRNQVKSLTDKLKKAFERDLAKKTKQNPKTFWQYINPKSKTKSGIGDLALHPEDPKSELTSNDNEKA